MTTSEETQEIKDAKKKKSTKKSTKPKLTPEEQEDYNNLVSRICRLYSINSPEPIMFRQIKVMKDKGISYAQQDYVLWYISEISKTFNTKYRLGQIEIHLNGAKIFALDQEEKEKRVKQIQEQGIKTIQMKYKPHTKNEIELLIDINQFLEEGEME